MNVHLKQRGFVWIEQIFKDIRYSLRMLWKNPGFTGITVISLALAIGVNSGVFSILNALIYRPLISLRPNEVVNVYTRGTAVDSDYRSFSFSEFSLLKESSEVFADVSAYQITTVGVSENSNSEIRRRLGFVVSDNYFSLLGATPAAGRFFLTEESRPNANIPVAVVSRTLWESLGGGKDFSERTVNINGEICTIVGVAPKGFSNGSLVAPDIWMPLGMADRINGIFGQDFTNSSEFTLAIIARLQSGLTPEAAKARLSVIAARLTTIAADDTEGARTLEIEPPTRFSLTGAQPLSNPNGIAGLFSVLLIGMAGVVLLVACLNLANMFLARNITRFDELSVRLALGASRRRVIRALSIEGLIIALLGGAAGLVLSRWANGLLLDSLTNSSALSSVGLSLSLDTTPDIRVLSATLLFCVIAALVFAVAPAWHAIREIAKGNLSLHHSTRTATDRSGRLFSGRHCLLMAQLALSLALLFSAGLFFRSAHSAARIDPGFTPEGDLVAEVDYSLVDRNEANVRTSIATIADTLRAHPEIREVALASTLPFGGVTNRFDVSTAGATGRQTRNAQGTWTAISGGYFDTLGIKLLRGRDFTDQECLHPEGPSVVIIDQGTAAALFPGEDPVGQYILNNPGPGETTSEPMKIVGVVSAHRDDVFSEDPPMRLFFPLAARSPQLVYIHMRGQTDEAAKSGAFREAVRRKLQSLDPDVPLVSMKPYPAILNDTLELWMERFIAGLFGVFGAIALLLAVIGVYCLRAFVVARRRREIGIRMALGASPRRIYSLLMKQGAVQIAIGLGFGLLLSLAAGKLLVHMLLRVSPGDPLVLALAALLLALTALLATWIPARRAAKVDPMEVLRWE